MIPAGEFLMGCSEGDDACNKNEKPQVRVYLDAFCMDRTEVTQGNYERVMGINPSSYKMCGPDCPVESLSWFEAKAYCEKLGMRLPTEAEWEKSARGGATTTYYWGNTMNGDYAWYHGNSGDTNHPTEQKRPNGYGLHDMLGNVWEWVQDCYSDDANKTANQRNPADDREECDVRVLRGGSAADVADFLRISYRDRNRSRARRSNHGFRCAGDI